MAENTLDKIIQDATRLPLDQQQRLIQVLTERLSQPSPKKTIDQIASEQGKRPLEFSKIRELGSFFPDDENVDDLIRTVRTNRGESR
jgi:mannose-6-phosphate isomerase class I